MSEYWSKDDVIENAFLDLQHERDDLQAELARRDERIAELEAMINPASFDKYLVGQLKDPDLAEQYAKAIVRDRSYKELYDKANEYLTDIKSAIARRDEIIARLKEDGDSLASVVTGGVTQDAEEYWECPYCMAMAYNAGDIHHTPDCPITLHRALIEELNQTGELK